MGGSRGCADLFYNIISRRNRPTGHALAGWRDRGLRSCAWHEARSREWWSRAVARWKRSGLTAAEFAQREDVSARTLSWWSSTLQRDTRAEHGSSAIEPIEIAVQAPATHGAVEIAVGGVVVRCELGADVAYVTALVHALRG